MKIFKWSTIRLVLLAIALGGLVSFTSARNHERKVSRVSIVFPGEENLFVTPEMVNKLLIEKNTPAQPFAKDKVDLNKLEKALNSHEMIEKSEVFLSIDGVLKAVVKQKKPIARVFDDSISFYIDSKGKKMPLSTIYTARVPVVYGRLDSLGMAQVSQVLRVVDRDEFLKRNITGATISKTGNVRLSSRGYDYVIDFGKATNIERKFANYKAFYQKASADSTLVQYKMINLKFTRQVVCTK